MKLNEYVKYVVLIFTILASTFTAGTAMAEDSENSYTMGLGCIFPQRSNTINMSVVLHGEESESNPYVEGIGKVVEPVNALSVVNNSILAMSGVAGEGVNGDRSEFTSCNSLPLPDGYDGELTFRLGAESDTESVGTSGGETSVRVKGPVEIEFERTRSTTSDTEG